MRHAASAPTDESGLTQPVVERICEVLAAYPAIEQVVLYGSRAKGNYRPGSDIDLAIVGGQFNDVQLAELEARLDDLLLPYSIDLCRFETIHNQQLVDHINRIGKIFYRQKFSEGTRLDSDWIQGEAEQTRKSHSGASRNSGR